MPLNSELKNHNPKLLVIVGPTASGKTDVAIELCRLLDGEIVSADSALVYRGMDIGSAKPTLEEQARAKHHLIDIRNPDEEYSAAQWAHDATRVIEELRQRGKQPIIVGGTGFYVNALLKPQLLAGAPQNFPLRKELEEFAAREGVEALHQRLAEVDAAAAARLHPNDVMRVVRAIEVAQYEATQPENVIAEEQQNGLEYKAFALEWPREKLYERIDKRVDLMLGQGFMQELEGLLKAGYGDTIGLQSLGYRQMRAALENPELVEQGLEEWKRQTRRYAKRQGTWFRHQLEVSWIKAVDIKGQKRSAAEVAGEIVAAFIETV
jgi:tRNA dimethylallyltransferase